MPLEPRICATVLNHGERGNNANVLGASAASIVGRGLTALKTLPVFGIKNTTRVSPYHLLRIQSPGSEWRAPIQSKRSENPHALWVHISSGGREVQE